MSGVSASSRKVIRSRNDNFRFLRRCNWRRSPAPTDVNASMAASRSRCSWRKRSTSMANAACSSWLSSLDIENRWAAFRGPRPAGRIMSTTRLESKAKMVRRERWPFLAENFASKKVCSRQLDKFRAQHVAVRSGAAKKSPLRVLRFVSQSCCSSIDRSCACPCRAISPNSNAVIWRLKGRSRRKSSIPRSTSSKYTNSSDANWC